MHTSKYSNKYSSNHTPEPIAATDPNVIEEGNEFEEQLFESQKLETSMDCNEFRETTSNFGQST
jgi:hypothetical protein